MLKTTL